MTCLGDFKWEGKCIHYQKDKVVYLLWLWRGTQVLLVFASREKGLEQLGHLRDEGLDWGEIRSSKPWKAWGEVGEETEEEKERNTEKEEAATVTGKEGRAWWRQTGKSARSWRPHWHVVGHDNIMRNEKLCSENLFIWRQEVKCLFKCHIHKSSVL